VGADGGVRDDAARRLGTGLRTELRRIQPNEGYLIEQGPVAHDLGRGVHREGQLLGAAERQVRGADHLPGALAGGKDEAVTLPWASSLVVLSGEDVESAGGGTEAEAGRDLQGSSSVNEPHLPCMRGPRVPGFFVVGRLLSRASESWAGRPGSARIVAASFLGLGCAIIGADSPIGRRAAYVIRHWRRRGRARRRAAAARATDGAI
jgi:hypothetical protein